MLHSPSEKVLNRKNTILMCYFLVVYSVKLPTSVHNCTLSHPLTVSINSNTLMIHSLLSSFPLHIYLAVSAASSGVSLSSLHGWFIHNGLVLNPTKKEAIYFCTSPRLQSLSHLTSIEVACGYICFTGRLYVKLGGVTFDKHLNFDEHISNVCSSSYFHILLSAIFALFLNQKLPRLSPVLLSVPNYNSILTGISSRNIHRLQRVQNSLARVVYSLNYQRHLGSKFTSLASNSATNLF